MSHPYLSNEHIRQPVDKVVPLAGRQEAVPPALFEAGQEVAVELQEVLQAGEQAVQLTRLHLQVLLQLTNVHAQHDLQRAHVVHLGLHQLWGGGERQVIPAIVL